MSKGIRAINDIYIEELINDPNVLIERPSTIKTRRDRAGKLSSEYREVFQDSDEKGYKKIKYKNKHLQVHRIIYRKFVGNLDQSLTINHKDGNPSNNSPENLELVSMSENQLHKYRVLNRPAIIGNFKISKDIADEIRSLRQQGYKYSDLMEKFGLTSKSTISYIINNKTWK